MSEFINADCLEVMDKYPNGYFDLAIVDPPYFSGPEKRRYYGRKVSSIGVKRLYGETSEWKVPDKDYFEELLEFQKIKLFGVLTTLTTILDQVVSYGIKSTGSPAFPIVS